jgi:hypothetical protein
LRNGSPDRYDQREDDYRGEEAFPLANALDYLLIALHEYVLPNFQEHFFDYWEGEVDVQAWSTVLSDLRWSAGVLARELEAITRRWQETQQPAPIVSVETSHGGKV